LTEDEVTGNAMLFFLAGYETTASTLTFMSYCLATNPEIQESLIDEIDSVLGKVSLNDQHVFPLHSSVEQLHDRIHLILMAIRSKIQCDWTENPDLPQESGRYSHRLG
jgi:cytochrome P450